MANSITYSESDIKGFDILAKEQNFMEYYIIQVIPVAEECTQVTDKWVVI